MATRVQQVSNTSSDVTSVTVTISAATAGNLLVAFAGNRGTPFATWATPAGWSVAIASFANSGTTASPELAVFYKVAAGGETSVVLSDASFGTGNMIGLVDEWSGLTSTPLDATATTDSGASLSVSASSGTTGTTAQADELALGVYCPRSVQSSASFTNSFVQDGFVTASTNATFPVSLITASKTLVAAATVESTCTWDVSARNIAAMVTFKATTAPALLWTQHPRLVQPMFRGTY